MISEQQEKPTRDIEQYSHGELFVYVVMTTPGARPAGQTVPRAQAPVIQASGFAGRAGRYGIGPRRVSNT